MYKIWKIHRGEHIGYVNMQIFHCKFLTIQDAIKYANDIISTNKYTELDYSKTVFPTIHDNIHLKEGLYVLPCE